MCGIVGVITGASNGFAQDEVQAFRDMLVVDSLRGFDSTGVFGVANNGNIEIIKDAITGAQFVTTKEYEAFGRQAYSNGQFMIGHNRYATRGTVNDKNAHPFWVDDKIILVQNGTYRGSHKHHKDVEVDTEAITHVLAEEADVSKALKKINAAYALVWYNTETHTLHLIRNNERPLWHVDTKFGSVMFASEPEFLLMSASRNKIALKALPEMLEPDVLYTYTLDKQKTWLYNEQKIDCTYDSKSGPNEFIYQYNESHWYPGKHISRNYGNYNYEDDPDTTVTQLHPQNSVQGIQGTDDPMITTINNFSAIYEGDFNDFVVTDEEAKKLSDEVHKTWNTKHIIELFEYKAGNRNPNCRVWHVYGKPLSADNDKEPKVLYHKTIWNKSEEEVVAYTMKGLYRVSIRSPITNLVKQYNNPFKNRVVSTVFYDDELISVYESEKAIQ